LRDVKRTTIVGELIEKLKEFDSELPVCIYNGRCQLIYDDEITKRAVLPLDTIITILEVLILLSVVFTLVVVIFLIIVGIVNAHRRDHAERTSRTNMRS
jgi:hypothetical protein